MITTVLSFTKAGVKLAGSIGVGVIIDNAVKATTPDNLGKVKNCLVWAGSAALTCVASNAIDKQFGEAVDSVVERVKNFGKRDKVEEEIETE